MGNVAEGIAEIVVHSKYSDEDRLKFAKIIKQFNQLYYDLAIQTWGITLWRGIHVLKPPTDMWIYQELIQDIKPDLIIESGSCYGGSALFMRDVLDNVNPSGKVLSIELRPERIKNEARKIGIIYHIGNSVSQETIEYVKAHIQAYQCKRVMVILDSDHSKEHVLQELQLYGPLVSVGSILIVEDTGNCESALEAVEEWLGENHGFRRNLMCEKLMLTFNRDGYIERHY